LRLTTFVKVFYDNDDDDDGDGDVGDGGDDDGDDGDVGDGGDGGDGGDDGDDGDGGDGDDDDDDDIVCQAILVFNIVQFTPLSYGDYVLPDWSQALGWLMAVAAVAVIPFFAVYQFIKLSPQPPYSQLPFWTVRIRLLVQKLTKRNFTM